MAGWEKKIGKKPKKMELRVKLFRRFCPKKGIRRGGMQKKLDGDNRGGKKEGLKAKDLKNLAEEERDPREKDEKAEGGGGGEKP